MNIHLFMKTNLMLWLIMLFVVGIYLYNFADSLFSSQIYSIVVISVAAMYMAAYGLRFDSWYFWFIVFFVLMYNIGLIFGLLFIGFEVNFLNYRTNFSNFVSDQAAMKSYIVTSIALVFCVLFYPYMSKTKKPEFMSFDRKYYHIGLFLVFISLPFVLYNLVHHLTLISQYGYAFLYTEAYQQSSTGIPLAGVFTNLNRIGFLFLFASFPPLKQVNLILLLFLTVALIDALKGSRILIILPVIWSIYYKARFYDINMLGGTKKYIYGIAAFAIVFILQTVRSNSGLDIDVLANFFVFSISKAQYHVAVFIENYDLFSQHSPFIFAPILFPADYLVYGDSIVGQSVTSAAIRSDLNHVMSSTLNLGAYLSGAGMGSSLISEIYQYGILGLPLFLTAFLIFYRYVFTFTERYRFLFILQPMLFMHIIFSARDTALPNSWLYIKFLSFILIFFMAYQFLSKITTQKASLPINTVMAR